MMLSSIPWFRLTPGPNAGTVTSVSVVTSQGVSGTVATATTTPAITLTLGALTGVTSFNGLVITANTGAITTGSWTATVVSPVYGGTGVANNVSSTITISGSFATTITISAATSVTLPTSGTLATLAGTETFTNKWVQARVQAVTDAATVTPAGASDDMVVITALAQAVTIANASGSPVQGQKLIIRFKDNATARAITWGTAYRASSDLALPTTTIISKTLYCGFVYNSTDAKWDLLAKLDNF